MSKTSDDFYAGVIAALAVVAAFDAETIFREIMNTVDEKDLVAFAQRDQAMEFSGLTRYGYDKKKRNTKRRNAPKLTSKEDN